MSKSSSMSLDKAHEPLMEVVAAGIAHEVRNPLNALQISLRILEQELHERIPDRAAHVFTVLGSIADEIRHLDEFVAEFLRFARPPRLKLERVPLRPLLTDLASFIAPQCASKQVSLHLSLERGASSLVADSFQLKRAILNLVLNALDATPSGGDIVIETGGGERAGELTIEVRDTGEGIPEALEAQVFDLFFTTREGGTGLGLPIAARIVRDHGGRLELRSEVGRGTRAILWLPLRPSSAVT